MLLSECERPRLDEGVIICVSAFSQPGKVDTLTVRDYIQL
jgi:hypothetical protein